MGETMSVRGSILAAFAMLALAGCNSSSSGGILGSLTSEQPLEAGQRERVVVEGSAPTQRKLAKRGAGIDVIVDGTPITDAAVRSRAAFVRIRKLRGNPRQVAREELIDEAIKMAEAKRRRTVASDKEVDAAYAKFLSENIARSRQDYDRQYATAKARYDKDFRRAQGQYNEYVRKVKQAKAQGYQVPAIPKGPQYRLPPKKYPSDDQVRRGIEGSLTKSGFSRKAFKAYIRNQISWQRAVQARMVRQGRSSGSGGTNNFQPWLPPKDAEITTVNEYTLQQVIFLVPANRRSQTAARRAAALRFRNQVDGCENTKTRAAGLRDVSVVDRGRVGAGQLPPDWRRLVAKTPSGKATELKSTPKGIEMIIVCRTRQVQEAKSAADLFSSAGGKTVASKVEQDYLAELKKKAVIQRR